MTRITKVGDAELVQCCSKTFLNCLFCRRAIAEGLASCYRQQRSNDWRVCGTTQRRLRHTYDEEALNNFARLSMSAGSVLLLLYDPPEDDGQGCGAVNAFTR